MMNDDRMIAIVKGLVDTRPWTESMRQGNVNERVPPPEAGSQMRQCRIVR